MAIGALLAIAACESRTPVAPGNLPTERPPGPADPGLPPIDAEITLRSISVEPGSTLMLRDCRGSEGSLDDPTYCTEDLQMLFDVAADRDLTSVGLRLTFMQEGQPCAFAVTPSTSLSAHVPARLDASLIQILRDNAARR
jgi:hypothetical protein